MKIYDYNGLKNLCGAQIRQERRRQRLTQEQLAARLQCRGVILERDSVSRIEAGERFIADFELVAISEALAVPLDTLIAPRRRAQEAAHGAQEGGGLYSILQQRGGRQRPQERP